MQKLNCKLLAGKLAKSSESRKREKIHWPTKHLVKILPIELEKKLPRF